MASCIAALRSLTTSSPHWSMARCAAPSRSWHSANKRWTAPGSGTEDRVANSRARCTARATASGASSVTTRAALRRTSASSRRSPSRSAAALGRAAIAASKCPVESRSPRRLARLSASLRRATSSGSRLVIENERSHARPTLAKKVSANEVAHGPSRHLGTRPDVGQIFFNLRPVVHGCVFSCEKYPHTATRANQL